MINLAKNILFGVAVGDALGVPVEFCSREELVQNPVTDMQEYGSYHQPRGTWSDDSSLTFCTAESLLNGYNLADMAERFCRWRENAYWTAHNEVFDIGLTTDISLLHLRRILNNNELDKLCQLACNDNPGQNGNGSLMRILPLLLYIKGMPIEKQFEIVWEVSALTHPHIRSAYACLIYLRFAENILSEKDKFGAYDKMQNEILAFFTNTKADLKETAHFSRIINQNISTLKQNEIASSGYVIHSLEAALWCLLTTNSYAECVLKAVNLGEDTDTTAAIAGGLAGILYGADNIPKKWVNCLSRKTNIEELSKLLQETYL
jgi:ADP-ribosylglycohydrolase